MVIEFIKEINLVKYHAVGLSVDAQCNSCMALSMIPGYQIRGYKNHFIDGYYHDKFSLDFCKANFYLYNQYLNSSRVKKELLNLIGDFFNLELNIGEDGNISYRKKWLFETSSTPFFAYYFDKASNLKLFFLYDYNEGQERSPELNTIYFHYIWQIDLNHDEFMRLYGDSPNTFHI